MPNYKKQTNVVWNGKMIRNADCDFGRGGWCELLCFKAISKGGLRNPVKSLAGFQVLTAAKMSMVVLYFVTQCGLVVTLSLTMEAVCSSKTLVSTYKPA
jgi:hypothetical protein